MQIQTLNTVTFRIEFDGRGLCVPTGDECDGMREVRYIEDPDRTSTHVRTGDREWHHPLDMERVA
jgi:hypothetical protein